MNTNDYLALNFTDIADPSVFFPQSRREFLKRLGGGIVIFVALGEIASAQEEVRSRGPRPAMPADFNAFLRIGEDGRITCFTGKIEMGQGPITSLPQMMADELDAPLDAVDIVMGDTELCPWDMGTFGSMTTRFFGPAMRAAAAEARAVLLELASESLKIPQSQLVTTNGVVVDQQDSKNRVTYGQLAKGRKIARHISGKPALKKASDFKIVGRPLLHRDGLDKVTGKAHYAGDIRMPGMLYAKVLRPPAHGARLKSVDMAPAREIPGVQIFQDDDLVAVLHQLPDVAEAALEKIKAEFDVPEAKVNDKNIFDHLLSVAPAARVLKQGRRSRRRQKELDPENRNKFSQQLRRPCRDGNPHRPCRHRGGQGDGLGVDPEPVWRASARLPRPSVFLREKVRVITPFVGGGFGGKTFNLRRRRRRGWQKPSASPSRSCGAVKRNFFYDTFRPGRHCENQLRHRCRRQVDVSGITKCSVPANGVRNNFITSRTSHGHSRFRMAGPAGAHPFGTGAWRAPGNNTNTFARESQIDIMAAAAGHRPGRVPSQQPLR